jgi:hypothetical protein
MGWEKILKIRGFEEEDIRDKFGEKLGEKTGQAFTMNMFYNQDWVKQLGRLLSIGRYVPETGEQETAGDAVTDEAIQNAVQYAVSLMNSLLEHTKLGDALLGASEKFSESTRTFSDEHQRPEPPKGESGRGMMPKRLEYAANSVSRSFDALVEKIMAKAHRSVDRTHASGKEPKDTVTQLEGTLPSEIVNYVWEQGGGKDDMKHICSDAIGDIVGDLSGVLETEQGIEYDKTGKPKLKDKDFGNTQAVMNDILTDDNTKRLYANIYVIIQSKIKSGMARRTSDRMEFEIGDLLTPEEKKDFEALSSMEDMGPMGQVKLPPELDPETGIPLEQQADFVMPQTMGQIDKPDFDPAEESEDKPAPQVKDYVTGRKRRPGEPDEQVPPEWRTFQEKNAMQKLQTDSFERSWETLKKR